MSDLQCSNCSLYLSNSPVQCPCGDRLSGDCHAYDSLHSSKKCTSTNCSKCAEEISLNDCFKDKAAENEVKTPTIKCTNHDCPWEGPGQLYMEHMASCKLKKIPCPNKQYGCPKLLLQSQWEEHLESECRFTPFQRPWCSKKPDHIKQECGHEALSCSNGCGEKLAKRDCAMEMSCPIPISDSMIEPGIFGFGTIVEANIAAALQPDSYRYHH